MRFIISRASCALCSVLVLCAFGDPLIAGDVAFADPRLETAVRSALGIPSPAPVTEADMLTMTGRFEARGLQMTALDGIEYAKNVTELNLHYNKISSVVPLATMTQLTWLDLGSNPISNPTGLGNLINLTYLNLGSNNLTDLSALAGVGSLATDVAMVLTHNQITDLSPLKDVPEWRFLYAYGNDIEDISCLANFASIRNLALGSNKIADISVLRDIGNPGFLSLWYNQISDLSPFADSSLHNSHVTLAYNLIVDVSPLSEMSFNTLDLRGNQISDIFGLSTITVYSFLDLRGNPLNDEAYDTYIPMIQANNPRADIRYDPIPEPASAALLLAGLGALLRFRDRRRR